MEAESAKLKFDMQTSLKFDAYKYSAEACLTVLRDYIRELKEPLIPNPKPFFGIYRILYGENESKDSLSKDKMKEMYKEALRRIPS